MKINLAWLLIIIVSACNRNNVHENKDWGKIYLSHKIDTAKAAFELYETSKERVFLFNKARGNYRLSPASTFKIVLNLVALETSVAPSEELVIKWDGVKNSKEAWNKDMNMVEAFKTSSEPYYKELARRIGKLELQKWVDTLNYGNKKIGGAVDLCWTDGSLQITPDEQIGLLKKLYFDELPFSKRTMRIVRGLMQQQINAKEKYYYKTGTKVQGSNQINWQVGYIEDSTNHPYFFANAFESDTSEAIMADRLNITLELLRAMSLGKTLK